MSAPSRVLCQPRHSGQPGRSSAPSRVLCRVTVEDAAPSATLPTAWGAAACGSSRPRAARSCRCRKRAGLSPTQSASRSRCRCSICKRYRRPWSQRRRRLDALRVEVLPQRGPDPPFGVSWAVSEDRPGRQLFCTRPLSLLIPGRCRADPVAIVQSNRPSRVSQQTGKLSTMQ